MEDATAAKLPYIGVSDAFTSSDSYLCGHQPVRGCLGASSSPPRHRRDAFPLVAESRVSRRRGPREAQTRPRPPSDTLDRERHLKIEGRLNFFLAVPYSPKYTALSYRRFARWKSPRLNQALPLSFSV